MKTVQEWAQELPEDVREKFLANVIEQRGEEWLKLEFENLSDVISGIFFWIDSPEGDEYWREIRNKLLSENR